MAYWVRKDSTFIDPFGNDFEIALLEDDTAGTTTEFAHMDLKAAFDTEYLKTGDEREPWGLQRLTAYLSVRYETTLLQDIRDSDEEKYRLRLRVAGSANNIYTLKIRTRDIDREIYYGPLQVIAATDGIDQLQSKEWSPTGTTISAAAMIRECLGQVGFNIGFRFSSDWYPTSPLVATDDPLNLGNRFDRMRVYNKLLAKKGGENALVTYYDLLEYMATQFQCLVKLDDNTDGDRWRIYQRLENHDAGGRYYWDYDYTGALTGSGTETTHAVTFDGTTFKQKGSMVERSLPAIKESRYIYEHDALTGNLDPSQGFSLWESGAPKDHTISGSTTVSHVGLFQDTHAIRIHDVLYGSLDGPTAAAAATKYGRYTTSDIAPAAGDQVDFAVTAATFPTEPIPLGWRRYWGAISILAVSANKWMDENGDWSDTETRIPIGVVIQDGKAELTSKVFSTTAVPSGTTAFQLTYYQLVDGYDATSKVGGIWYGRVEPIFKPSGSRENTQTVYESSIDGENTTELREHTFYLGQGPIDDSSPGRLLYQYSGLDYDAKDFVRGNGAAGSGIDFARFWNHEFLRQFRIGVLDREWTFQGDGLPGASDVVIQGSTRFDAFYKYRRSWGDGICVANWVEIRSDSLTLSHTDLTREWEGIDPTDDGADTDGKLPEPTDGFTLPQCITLVGKDAVFPMLDTGVDGVVWNAIRGVAGSPDGVMTPDNSNFTYSLAGLSKAASSDYIALPWDLIGANAIRMVFTGMWRRDATTMTLYDLLAGTAGRYKLEVLSTGVVRFAVTDNAATSTVNVDSDLLVGLNEYFMVTVAADTYTGQLYLFLELASGAAKRYPAVHPYTLSSEFYDNRMMTAGAATCRIQVFQGDGQIPTLTQFKSLANCLANFASAKGVTSYNGEYDAIEVYSNTYLRAYDHNGNLVESITHGLTPGSIGRRPSYIPTVGKWAVTEGTRVLAASRGGAFSEVLDFGGTKLCRALAWSDSEQRLYYGTADAAGTGQGELGYFTDVDTATWSKTVISTDYPILDLSVGSKRFFALVGDAMWGAIVEIRLDGTEVDRVSIDTAVAVSQAAHLESFYYMLKGGSDEASVDRVEPVVYGGEGIEEPVFNLITGSDTTFLERCGLAVHNASFRAFMLAQIAAGNRILRFDPDEEGQTAASNTVDAIIDVDADDVRGIALVKLGITAPDAPSGLSVTADGSDAFNLTWTDNSDDEVGFAIQESDDGATGWVTIATVAAGTEAATVDGYDAETYKCFRVLAYNGGGYSDPSNVDCDTTAAGFSGTHVMFRAGDAIKIVPIGGGTVNTWKGSLGGTTHFLAFDRVNRRVYYTKGSTTTVYSDVPGKTDEQNEFSTSTAQDYNGSWAPGYVFAVENDYVGIFDIVAASYDGTGIQLSTLCTSSSGAVTPNSADPDALKLLIPRSGKLVVTDLDGSNENCGTVSGVGPAFSPCAIDVAAGYLFYRYAPGDDIYRVDYPGFTNPTLLVNLGSGSRPRAMVAHDGWLYYVTQNNYVARISYDGVTQENIIPADQGALAYCIAIVDFDGS